MIEAKGGTKLARLDKERDAIAQSWRNESFDHKKNEVFLTKDQLLNTFIEWKFLKGKPRNALQPLLQSNSEAAVRKHSLRAFELADNIPAGCKSGECNELISASLSELCELKGVGPATASAILCIYRPDVFAFMDDEVIECLYDGKRGYTLKIYMDVNSRCRALSEELEKARTKSVAAKAMKKEIKWTPCKVGQALWTVATLAATKNEQHLSNVFDASSDKKKSVSKNNSIDSKNGVPTNCRKRRDSNVDSPKRKGSKRAKR